MQRTSTISLTEADISRAADILDDGGLVAFPTETVYGLGGDARNGKAVARIFQAKDRPSFNPLIVHVADIEHAIEYVHWTDDADRLASAFWPGPISFVLPLRQEHGLSPLVTADLPTLAIRVPAHPVARKLLRAFNGPIAAPSANPSGRISPTTAAHVHAGLDGKIDAVIDGGACEVGLESTIVGLSNHPILLRPGGIPLEAIEAALGYPIDRVNVSETISAPGQMRSHYAPQSSIRLDAQRKRENEVLLGFGPVDSDLNLSPSGDLVEAASNLFGHLHALDRLGRPIAVSPIPHSGLGRAINDRLQRAAAPRSEI